MQAQSATVPRAQANRETVSKKPGGWHLCGGDEAVEPSAPSFIDSPRKRRVSPQELAAAEQQASNAQQQLADLQQQHQQCQQVMTSAAQIASALVQLHCL